MAYNGYKNYETWNVALWIGSDEALYREAVAYAREHGEEATYAEFVKENLLTGMDVQTPDGAWWMDPELDYEKLDEMIRELGE
jgi:hypothetical protein